MSSEPDSQLATGVDTRSLPRSSSKDSLSSHPLVASTEHVPGPTSSPPRYTPYISRQSRAAQSIQLSVASVPASKPLSASSSAHDGSTQPSAATSKLQLQHLKAAAQRIGLNIPSYGWSMLETIVHDGDLDEVWDALTLGKATLLLPAEETPPGDKIPADDIKNHVVFLDHAAISSTPLITLSGLKGTSNGSVIRFQSSISPEAKAFRALKTPSSRRSALAALPALPQVDLDRYIYPSFTLYPNTAVLPLPPRPHKSQTLPHPVPVSPAAGTRLGLPFVSLFGTRSTSNPVSTPPRSTTPSIDLDRTSDVAAIVIDKKISANEIGRQIIKSSKQAIRDAFKGHSAPQWLSERVESFMTSLWPFVKTKRGAGGYQLQEYQPNDLSSLFQDFYDQLESDLGNSVGSPKRHDTTSAGENENKEEQEKGFNEFRIRELLELTEALVTTQLYDRLFRPESVDDEQHDDALSSRIAALNMLDLSLETLGVDAGGNGHILDKLIAQCGDALSRLELPSHQSPASKNAVLVEVHHLLVDGLSRIPPLKLKAESDIHPPTHSSHGELSDGRSVSAIQELQPVKSSDAATEPTAPAANGEQDTDEAETNPQATPVSGDVLLPLIIYSVVKSNPIRLVSHLLYVQRFRNRGFGGEESYCLVNLMAVVEFLEHVDLAALGLGDSERVLSTEKLSPIPIDSAALDGSHVDSQTTGARLRGLVVQEVDALAGSANRVLTGVVGTSFGVLRGFLATGGQVVNPAVTLSGTDAQAPQPMHAEVKPGFGLLRRASGFSISSMAASFPGAGKPKVLALEEGGQQMIDVVPSRAASISERPSDDDTSSEANDTKSDDELHREEQVGRSDARSVRSFSSMMSTASKDQPRRERKALSDRLAGSLSRASGPPPREPLLKAPPSRRNSLSLAGKPVDPPPSKPISRIAPPKKRFLECSAEDLRLSEVGELLVEYRRLVEGLRSMDGFENE